MLGVELLLLRRGQAAVAAAQTDVVVVSLRVVAARQPPPVVGDAAAALVARLAVLAVLVRGLRSMRGRSSSAVYVDGKFKPIRSRVIQTNRKYKKERLVSIDGNCLNWWEESFKEQSVLYETSTA